MSTRSLPDRRGAPARGISAFVVDADTPSFLIAERIETISPASAGADPFRELPHSGKPILGAPGEGFKIAMHARHFRPSVAAAAVGFAPLCAAETVIPCRIALTCSTGATLADLPDGWSTLGGNGDGHRRQHFWWRAPL